MNDFTKEELDICREGVSWLIESHSKEYGEKEVALWFPLMNKIQSLIDNYCINNGHNYEFSLGRGKCENCGELE